MSVKNQKKQKQMKTKVVIALTGLVACRLAFAQTNGPAADASASAGTTNTNAVAEATTNATTEVTVTTEPSAAVLSTNSTVIPLIVMDDVPLTDAIKNLARQAGLNYMLDPKISYGQPDPKTGTIATQPLVSIRWENVTAEQALAALLNNYSFQLVADPRTHIYRV